MVVFSWKGADLSMEWPRAGEDDRREPSAAALTWAATARPLMATMLPSDAAYLSNLFEAMAYIVSVDSMRSDPIISTTPQFAAFHAGSLAAAVRRKLLGDDDRVWAAVLAAFLAAVGPESRPLVWSDRGRIIDACAALSWAFTIPQG